MATPLKVTGLPGQHHVYTNAVFVNPDQARLLRSSFHESAFVTIDDKITYEIRSDPLIPTGAIALNALQRNSLLVSEADVANVAPFVVPADRNLNLAILRIEIVLLSRQMTTIEEDTLVEFVLSKMANLVWCVGQQLAVDMHGIRMKFFVVALEITDLGKEIAADARGNKKGVILPSITNISFDTAKSEPLLTIRKSRNASRNNIFQPSFNFSQMGIGGLDVEFQQIFRRAFVSRAFPADFIQKLGIAHVRGMLLHGPPGTGKTLIARQIGKMLHGREPKIVNGPEILNKYVGASEENIRNLFKDAEDDYTQNGESADLHIIIFDEIDAICKQRGSTNSGTGVQDNIVNQLLSKIDGVNSLNNILVIGMTNRKDLIDEAFLRPGRLEVIVEIGLPDESGRFDILMIHTKNIRDAGCLDADVDLHVLAAETKNFSGAEIAGLVRSATSFALRNNVDVKADSVTSSSLSETRIQMAHFRLALREITPAFGMSEEDLKNCVRGGIIDYGPSFESFMQTCREFVEEVKNSPETKLRSVLFKGRVGCGKTAIAAKIAIDSGVPFVKFITAEDCVGMSESEKVARLLKVFRDAYKSPVSIIIIDNIEGLIEYLNVGPRLSNTVLQALRSLIGKVPPQDNRRMLIIGTTSSFDVLEDMHFNEVFNFILEVPQLQTDDEVRLVLQDKAPEADPAEVDLILRSMRLPIVMKQLLVVITAALQLGQGHLTHHNVVKCLHHIGLGASLLR